jgi:hypothetical protein
MMLPIIKVAHVILGRNLNKIYNFREKKTSLLRPPNRAKKVGILGPPHERQGMWDLR